MSEDEGGGLRLHCEDAAGQDEAWTRVVTGNPAAAFGHGLAAQRFEAGLGVPGTSFLVRDHAGSPLAVVPAWLPVQPFRAGLERRLLTGGVRFAAGPLLAPGLGARVVRAVHACIADELLRRAARHRVDRIDLFLPAVVDGRLAVDVLGHTPLHAHGFEERPWVALLVALDPPEEALLAGFDRQRRKNLRRADGLGLVARPLRDAAEWRRLVDGLDREHADPGNSPAFLAALHDALLAHADCPVLVVEQEGRLLNALVSRRHGALEEAWIALPQGGYREVPGVASWMYWQAMRAARAAGVRWFHLGAHEAGDARQQSIARFKFEFSPRAAYQLRAVRDLGWVRPALFAALELRGAERRRAAALTPPAAPPP
ncbi:MAG: GNAT family N-acetyltransferase [Gemmatimonadales bacterium]|nr:GNAT family N-acetyltransferase [Gemmatimonadales bacterium]